MASEFATNSVLHSVSRHGGAFTLRVEVSQDCLRIWRWRTPGGRGAAGVRDDGRPHGFDVVTAIAGPGNWGIDGDSHGRTPGPGSAGEVRMTVLPSPGDAARVACFLADQPRWSVYWDKKYGLWRVAEDDPDSDLYAESSDADVVISYITANA